MPSSFIIWNNRCIVYYAAHHNVCGNIVSTGSVISFSTWHSLPHNIIQLFHTTFLTTIILLHNIVPILSFVARFVLIYHFLTDNSLYMNYITERSSNSVHLLSSYLFHSTSKITFHFVALVISDWYTYTSSITFLQQYNITFIAWLFF